MLAQSWRQLSYYLRISGLEIVWVTKSDDIVCYHNPVLWLTRRLFSGSTQKSIREMSEFSLNIFFCYFLTMAQIQSYFSVLVQSYVSQSES
jgi:hypothetical protein